MNYEKLIENVKACEPLYIMSHSKYSDNIFKENAWRGIGKEMNQSAAICKKKWTNLRDSFRRALKKRRETKSGQAVSKIKKWKFEDEMSFLLPFMQERDTYSNLKDVSDDEYEPNEDEYNDKSNDIGDDHTQKDDTRDNRNDDREDDQNNDKDDDKDDMDDMDEKSYAEEEKKKKQKKINRKIITSTRKENRFKAQAESASAVMMKYLLDKKSIGEQIIPPTQQHNAIDMFFSSIAATVKNFSPYYQNIAKSQIFSIVTDLEMKQIMEQGRLIPNTTAQHQHQYSAQIQSHYTGPYNVPRPISTPSPSPSISSSIIPISYNTNAASPSSSRLTTTTSSPSYCDLPTTLMSHLT